MVKKNGKRSYLLLDESDIVVAKFENKYPRGAALKAANKGFTTIKLLERGSKNTKKGGWKIHVFTGERTRISKPDGAPAWMSAEVYKPTVIKMGIERKMVNMSDGDNTE
jgi:hypothetical protein